MTEAGRGQTTAANDAGDALGLEEDYALLVSATREAGAIALKRFRTKQKIWHKGGHHRVCEADMEVDAFLRDRLLGARPKYAWLSEESEDNRARLSTDKVWIIDPIDGTNSYLEDIPEFAVAAALVQDGRPIAASVFNPAQDEMFEARIGDGAKLNGALLAVSDTRNQDTMRMLASRSERREAGWPNLFGDSIHAMSSIAYKLALVAAGRFDATASLWPKNDWDICAAHLLIEEAGGRMSTITGEPLRFNRERPRHATCLATNGHLHDGLMARLAELVD